MSEDSHSEHGKIACSSVVSRATDFDANRWQMLRRAGEELCAEQNRQRLQRWGLALSSVDDPREGYEEWKQKVKVASLKQSKRLKNGDESVKNGDQLLKGEELARTALGVSHDSSDTVRPDATSIIAPQAPSTVTLHQMASPRAIEALVDLGRQFQENHLTPSQWRLSAPPSAILKSAPKLVTSRSSLSSLSDHDEDRAISIRPSWSPRELSCKHVEPGTCSLLCLGRLMAGNFQLDDDSLEDCTITQSACGDTRTSNSTRSTGGVLLIWLGSMITFAALGRHFFGVLFVDTARDAVRGIHESAESTYEAYRYVNNTSYCYKTYEFSPNIKVYSEPDYSGTANWDEPNLLANDFRDLAISVHSVSNGTDGDGRSDPVIPSTLWTFSSFVIHIWESRPQDRRMNQLALYEPRNSTAGLPLYPLLESQSVYKESCKIALPANHSHPPHPLATLSFPRVDVDVNIYTNIPMLYPQIDLRTQISHTRPLLLPFCRPLIASWHRPNSPELIGKVDWRRLSASANPIEIKFQVKRIESEFSTDDVVATGGDLALRTWLVVEENRNHSDVVESLVWRARLQRVKQNITRFLDGIRMLFQKIHG